MSVQRQIDLAREALPTSAMIESAIRHRALTGDLRSAVIIASGKLDREVQRQKRDAHRRLLLDLPYHPNCRCASVSS